MITDNDRNTRTLILSFVIAIMALIPLRFYEAGEQQLDQLEHAAVLGAMTTRIAPTATPTMPLFDEPWNK